MKKLHNNKLALGLTIGCSIVALATVGFSSWVISVVTGAEVSNINVQVADIKDKSVSITEAALLGTNNTFAFGPQSGDNSGSIQNDGTEAVEDLTFGITYKVNITDVDQASLQSVTATVAVSNDTAGTAYTTAITNGYFVSPLSKTSILASASNGVPVATGADTDAIYTTVTSSDSTYTCTTIFTYKWGAAFAGLNPAVYVDSDSTVTGGSVAKTVEAVKAALTSLYAANGAKLTITLSPSVE
jgi:tetrahydromethanopterin S-methyltransferase subunit F